MTTLLIGLTIGLPWLGALTVWLVGDARPRRSTSWPVSSRWRRLRLACPALPCRRRIAVLRIPLGAPSAI